MKRLVVLWMLCTILSAGSFAVLVVADRRLGVALPFSLPIAFAAMSALAPGLFALFEALRARRPIVVREAPVVVREVAAPSREKPTPSSAAERRRGRRAQGLVLLDCSSFPARERAA
jgi:hypothetical protein